MRVVSLLPSCTEVLFVLGVDPVGVSHSCDHPPAVSEIPAVTSTGVEYENRSAGEIDAQMQSVSGAVYDLDVDRLAALEPDLVITQATCDICAVDSSQVQEAVTHLDSEPAVLTLDPHSFTDVLDDITRIGDAIDESAAAETLRMQLTTIVERVNTRAKAALESRRRPRTAVLDWTDPPLRAGHWVTEMIERAGGDASFQPEHASEPIRWSSITRYDPKVLLVAPCGFDGDRAAAAVDDLREYDGWQDLTAVANGAVYAADGNALFTRPSHRLVESLQLLQWCIHSEHVEIADEIRSCVRDVGVNSKPSV